MQAIADNYVAINDILFNMSSILGILDGIPKNVKGTGAFDEMSSHIITNTLMPLQVGQTYSLKYLDDFVSSEIGPSFGFVI